jgi:hypothetical protein
VPFFEPSPKNSSAVPPKKQKRSRSVKTVALPSNGKQALPQVAQRWSGEGNKICPQTAKLRAQGVFKLHPAQGYQSKRLSRPR